MLVWFLCAIAFLKVSQKIDSFLSSLGLNVGHTGGSMLSEAMIAMRAINTATSAVGSALGSRSRHGSAPASGKSGSGSAAAAGFFSGGLVGMASRKIASDAVRTATTEKNIVQPQQAEATVSRTHASSDTHSGSHSASEQQRQNTSQLDQNQQTVSSRAVNSEQREKSKQALHESQHSMDASQLHQDSYDKDIKGSVLIRTDDVELKNLTVDGDLIIGCGAADGKITLDNVTVKGRLLVWGGGIKAVYCNNGTQMPEVVVARVDDAVKVIYDRDSTLAVIDTIKVRITERAKQHKETEVIFYDVSGLREAQKQLNAIVADNQIALTAPAHLYALVGESSVKAEFTNNSKNNTYKVEIRRNKDNALIADIFELAAGKSISSLTLLEAPEFGNADCTVTITAFCDGKQIGTLNTELTLHTSYLWPKEVQ